MGSRDKCTTIDAAGTLDDCGMTVTPGEKSFRLAGPFDPAVGGALRTVGGTGAFAGATATGPARSPTTRTAPRRARSA